MAWTISHFYLISLIFLHTFTMLLCASTYVNHGLPTNQDLEASVRSRIKHQIIPEIYNKNRKLRRVMKSSRGIRSTFSLQTFCSVNDSHVLCSAGSSRERTTRSVDSQPEGQQHSLENRADQVDTAQRITTPPSSSLSLQQEIIDIIHEYEQEVEETINGQRHTNHERTARQSATVSTANTSPITTTPTPSVQQEHQHVISDHDIESRTEYSNPGYHDVGCDPGFCYHQGICHFDPITSEKLCM